MIAVWARHPRYGWVVVVASAALMAFSFGTLVCVSVFLKPLEAEFGWSRAATAFAYSSSAFLAGAGGILMGRLVDRIAPLPIVFTGALMVGGAQLLLGQIDSLWQLYLIYGVMAGALGNGAILTPVMVNAGFWFERHKGLAIGAVMMGQSLGAAGVPFLARWLVERLDWRTAYETLGLLAWIVLIPAALLVRQAPDLAERKASARREGGPAGPLSPPALTAALCSAIVFCCICMSIPIVHVYPLAVESGIAPAQAAGVLGLFMVTSSVGRIGIGRVADLIGGPRALWLASLVQTATIYWFTQAGSGAALYAVAVAFGIGYGGVLPSYAIIVRELIPAHRAGRSLGLVFFFGNVGMGLGGWIGGLLYDWSGGYPLAFATGALSGMVNLAIVGALIWALARRAAEPAPAATPAG
jgi:MFS family permease